MLKNCFQIAVAFLNLVLISPVFSDSYLEDTTDPIDDYTDPNYSPRKRIDAVQKEQPENLTTSQLKKPKKK
ncbi:MAG: hypothetical protein K2P93_09040 [Alphaproteobacteria bacterium]|nr:hypothetical protein [Alphaproteobacteria bacterium]